MDSKINEKASITVASKALGVSVKTIQRWVKSGKIQGIREDGRVFIQVDDIRAMLQGKRAGVQDIDQDKKEGVRTDRGHNEDNTGHIKDKSPDVIPIDRTHYEGLLTRLGQLEAKQELLLEYKVGIEAKDKALEQARESISAQAQELAKAKASLTEANSELWKMAELRHDIEVKGQVISNQQAALEAKESELKRLLKVKQEAEARAETLRAKEIELAKAQAELDQQMARTEALEAENNRLKTPWFLRWLKKGRS